MDPRIDVAGTNRTLRFRAMNTAVAVRGADRDVQPWFTRVESLLSRFDPESALSQLNRRAERWTAVPYLLYRVIRTALRAAAVTEGAFDPTIADALAAAGYSRSFELGPTPTGLSVPAGGWNRIQLAASFHGVWLPEGVHLDLGGIGKGWAVDRLAAVLRHLPRLVINAGGDLIVRTDPGEPPVRVEVSDPFDPDATLATFPVRRGAVATSSTMGRRWGPGLHHIIDPRSGRPAHSGLAAATVFAASVVKAEVLAKACLVLGAEAGLRLIQKERTHALLVTDSGQKIWSPGLEEHAHAKA